MISRLIISTLPFFPLVHGNRKCRAAPQPASNHHSGLSQSPVPTPSLEPKPDDNAYMHIGHFVYESEGPSSVKIVFVGLPGDVGMFSVECETAHQSNWFPLHRPEGDRDVIHVVPKTGPVKEEHGVWIDGVEAACPEADGDPTDFSAFHVNDYGDAMVEFEGDFVTLKRTWLPLIPGSYSNGESPLFEVKMHYNIGEGPSGPPGRLMTLN
ncbi:hypothetical protein FOZ63_033930 [Perkinsus olseni]|uniref:Uncharacterized protein n=1 Tax=Perkinsus olseni TaxID=32597 RepID=A0A7J6PY41_PEROL|nr:hypothetical protein FOZ60_003828 [Perkinsus olseni]KAF4700576.1 hypothetical protein FOZ62_027752 [Perkinsus olseni]KAF4747032.1 hypothetical protein FOZ63_033930 [Perkinsus olseni]